MSNIRYWRVFKLTGICMAVVFLIAISPISTKEALAENNVPVISSEPTLVITTDQTYSYTIATIDIDNDVISYNLTTAPEGMTLSGNIITWSPITAGTYNVVLEASDNKNGFDSQAWQINVNPGDVRTIVVTPNDRPTIMTVDQTHQFKAMAYDKYGNLIEGTKFSWTSDGEFTAVDSNGLVTAVEPGTGYVKANIGDIQSAPGIVVKAKEPIDEIVTNTNNNGTEDGDELIENDENTENAELFTALDNDDEEDTEEEVCDENINHSFTFFLLIIYAAILVIYFLYEKKHKSPSWWIFPLLISFIGLIVYYRYFCPQTYLWWPWVMVIIGVIITGYYKGRTDKDDDISKNELPF